MSDADHTELLAEPPDQALLQALSTEAGLDLAQLEALVAQQAAEFTKAQQALSGTAYVIHAPTRTLYLLDWLSQESLAVFPLFSESEGLFAGSEPPELDLSTWEPWGTAFCVVNPHNGSIERFLHPPADDLYGLVITASTSFLYTREPLQTAILAQTAQVLYPRMHKGSAPNTAYDLYLSEDRSYLCISDREGGRLLLFDINSQQPLGWVQIRPPGSDKVLNVAFDYYEPKLFITDNQSPQLFVLSLPDLNLEVLPLGLPGQVFGNLVRSPDIRYIYLLTLKPSVGLHSVNLENEEFEEQIQLKGTLFSAQPLDPCDLMILTPDQNHLLVLSNHHDPTPGTPGLSVIDPHQFQPLRFQPIADALKQQTKPVGLVFALPNPLVGLQKTPLELLLEHKLLSPEVVAAQRQRLEQGDAAPEASQGPPEVVNLDDPDAPSQGQGPVPELDPQAAESMDLPPKRAIPAILFALGQKLYQQTEIDLQAQPEELARFEALAEGYRQQLETQDAVTVEVENILGKFSLQTQLTRQEILSMLARGYLRREGIVRPPQHCPACNQALKGKWDCPVCFLELESPQRQTKKAQTSLDALGAVATYQVLITDPERRRLLILDDKKTIDWELSGPELPCASPWSSLWLSNKNLLLVDRDQSQVLECSPSGKPVWSLDASLNPELQLLHPVKATYFAPETEEHFLIVDQGQHRVLVVNRKQQLIWQYGVRAEAGSEPGYLNRPADLQRTFAGTYLIADSGNDRVLEIQDDQIIRCFGPELGLRAPVYAQRLFDHDTLVVDSGNYRLLEIDSDGQLVSECFYFTDEMGEDMRIDAPTQVFRREKKSLVLMDSHKMIEILPPKQRLVWSSLLEHLARRIEIKRDAFDKSDSYVQSFYQYRLPTMAELLARLREENRLGSSEGIAQRIFENLNQLVDERRERDQQQSRSAQVKHLHETPLLELPIYAIDRINQQVTQLDRAGNPVWHFGSDPDYKLLRPTHVSETPDSLLIADTHHDRVLEVSLGGQAVLQVLGNTTRSKLSKPRSAWRTLLGHTLISDQGHKRLVELDAQGEVVWSFGESREISYPYYAMELGQGTILYVDWALHVVKEISREGELIWAYGQSSRMGHEENRLASPEYAVRLQSGAMLIADTGNHRILEVSPQRKILWEFSGSKKYTLFKPHFCQRQPNGHTLIAYHNGRKLLEVDREGEACWYFELGSEALAKA